MTGWILLLMACAACGALAFSIVRGPPALLRRAQGRDDPATVAPTASEPAPQSRAVTAHQPEPTAERPGDQQLALWASQVEAGTRKMTVATDGCRVTWSRSCKHGHPSWIVYLGSVAATPPPER